MREPCFRKRESNPPVCGVHEAILVAKVVSIDANLAGLGLVACMICPISLTVVRETRRI
jgi:hypothetical protein